MDEKPFISIIVPYYNTPEKYFRRCVDSVARQTYGNYEMIVVDDGSSQEHQAILAEIAGTDSRIRVIHKQNEGSAVARNVGIQSARYEYIMFLDSDDTITEWCLEEATEVIKEEKADLVIGLVKKIYETDTQPKNNLKSESNRIKVDTDDQKGRLVSHMIGYQAEEYSFCDGYFADGPIARVLKKAIALNSMFSIESFWDDDTVWNLQMIKNCKRIVVMNNLWYQYLVYPTSKTRKFRENCPYEFNYRINQELDLAKKLWPNNLQGVYHKIFSLIGILGRTFLFHLDNPLSHHERYQAYKECIHEESYREALQGISFRNEHRLLHRAGKEILRFCSYHGPHIISYCLLGLYYRFRKDTL